VNQRAVLVSPAGPAAWSYGLHALVSSYDQKADLGRQVARLAWRATGGRPVMRIEAAVGSGAKVRLMLRGNVLLGTSGPGVSYNSF
jgi:hypothetical protein